MAVGSSAVLADARYTLALRLLYGTGMRLMELIRLRVKDVDLERGQVVIRGGKVNKDRMTVLPESVRTELQAQLERVRILWQQDVQAGNAGVSLPAEVEKKHPNAARGLGSGVRWIVFRANQLKS